MIEVEKAIQSLSKKHDVLIKGHTVFILSPHSKHRKNDLGNGSWGKIDRLRKALYSIVFVPDYSKKTIRSYAKRF